MKATRILWNAIFMPATPISTVEFSSALAKIWSPPQRRRVTQGATIGLAISGGVDSMALAALCSQLQRPLIPNGWNDIDEPESQNEPLSNLRFQAFVVDHDVRAGSNLEAQAVSEVLERRGIPTEILKIRWPRTSNPNEKQGFESLARKHRFRILGKACRDLRINSLLLAHHEDDQAETVLMRMISGHRLAGLAGIRERSEIPENYGIYGVHESGGDLLAVQNDPNPSKRGANLEHHLMYEDGGIQLYRPMLGFSKARLIATCEEEEMKWFEDHTNKDPSLTARNAIRHIYANYNMPAALSKASLLSMSANVKERLAFRKAVVDRWLSSDKIRSFETRSGTLTIRFPHIKRLKNLESWSMSEKKQMAAEMVKRILMLVTPEEHIEVSSLHGALARLFPEIESPDDDEEAQSPTGFTVAGVQFQPELEYHEQQMETQKKRKPEWFLSRQPLPVASNRKPASNIEYDGSPQGQSRPSISTDTKVRDRSGIVDDKIAWSPIFKSMHHSEAPLSNSLLPTHSDNPSATASQDFVSTSETGYVEAANEPSNPSESFNHGLPPTQLIISKYSTPREVITPPSDLSQPPPQTINSPSTQHPLHPPPSNHPKSIHIPSTSPGTWSPWSLFDNRFWIRIINPSPYPLHVKHFTRNHLSSLKNTLPKPYRIYVQDLLKRVAPGNVRWTLPVLVKRERAWGWEQGEWLERVVGLPTLDIRAFVESQRGEEIAVSGKGEMAGLEGVRWEVRYKKINLDGIPLAKDLKPRSAHVLELNTISETRNGGKKAELRCIACGSPGHVEETCWKAHPELKPTTQRTTDAKASSEPDITAGEEIPQARSSTKKKILKRVAWLKVIKKARTKSRKEKEYKNLAIQDEVRVKVEKNTKVVK